MSSLHALVLLVPLAAACDPAPPLELTLDDVTTANGGDWLAVSPLNGVIAAQRPHRGVGWRRDHHVRRHR